MEHSDYMDANYHSLSIDWHSSLEVDLYIHQPGAFPDPEVTHVVAFHCNTGLFKTNEMVAESYSTDLAAAKAYLDTLPYVDHNKMQFRMKDFRITCEDNLIKIQGPDLDRLIRTLSLSSFGLGGSSDSLEFFIDSGYIYPNIRVDSYRFSVLANISEGRVSASVENDGAYSMAYMQSESTVALIQDGIAQPVLFDGQESIATFDPNKNATLAVQRQSSLGNESRWDVVKFNYADGSMTWTQSNSRPY